MQSKNEEEGFWRDVSLHVDVDSAGLNISCLGVFGCGIFPANASELGLQISLIESTRFKHRPSRLAVAVSSNRKLQLLSWQSALNCGHALRLDREEAPYRSGRLNHPFNPRQPLSPFNPRQPRNTEGPKIRLSASAVWSLVEVPS
jgi:hypothetical protein